MALDRFVQFPCAGVHSGRLNNGHDALLLQHDDIPFLLLDVFHSPAVFDVLFERVSTGRVLAGHDSSTSARLGKARENAGQVVHVRVTVADEEDPERSLGTRVDPQINRTESVTRNALGMGRSLLFVYPAPAIGTSLGYALSSNSFPLSIM